MVTNNWTPERIKELRAKLGLTMQRFAESLGVNTSTVLRWESGSQKPGRKAILEKLELLASDN